MSCDYRDKGCEGLGQYVNGKWMCNKHLPGKNDELQALTPQGGKGGGRVIKFDDIDVGDKVKVVGMGAPGFAALGDTLEITRVLKDRVYAKREDGNEAFFALTCGASRLEKVPQ